MFYIAILQLQLSKVSYYFYYEIIKCLIVFFKNTNTLQYRFCFCLGIFLKKSLLNVNIFRYYTPKHEWVNVQGTVATVGVSK